MYQPNKEIDLKSLNILDVTRLLLLKCLYEDENIALYKDEQHDRYRLSFKDGCLQSEVFFKTINDLKEFFTHYEF